MKKFALSLIALCIAAAAYAQGPQKGAANRLESEHVAFLTQALDLSPEEAQAFWPVYNKAKKEDREAYKEVMEKGKALREAVKEEKGEEEISRLLDEYQKAKADKKDVFAACKTDFVKAVGIVKTAKFYLAEENFRNKQIHNLRGHGPGGNRPQKGPGNPGQGSGKPKQNK